MAKVMKWMLVVLGVAGAASALVSSHISSKKTGCLSGQGKPAMEACGFLIKWQTGANRAEALFKRSKLYAIQGLHEREIADLEAIVPLLGAAGLPPARRAEIYVALSVAAGRKGDQAASVKYSEQAVQAGTSDPQVYLALAGAYIEAGRFQESVSLLENAGGVEKKHPYYNTLAAAYGGLGDYGRAYEALKTGLTVKAPRPVLAETAKHMGLVCFELKRYKEAAVYLNYAQRSGANCPECPLLLTTIKESLGAY